MAVILFAVFIDLVGFGLIVPILPFLTLEYGHDPLVGTALVSIYALMAFIAGPMWGRLSDRIGRKRALAMTFAGGTLSYTVLAFADSMPMLFVARAMSGAMAGNIGIVMASVADMTEPQNRGRYMGLIGAAFGLGFAVGPGLGGLLADIDIGATSKILLPGLVAAGLAFSAMILTLLFMKETHPKSAASGTADDTDMAEHTPPWTAALKGQGTILLFAMFMVAAVGQSIQFSTTPFWLEATLDWTVRQVGLLLMVVGLLVAFMQSTIIGPLFKAVGEVRALLLGALLQLAACLMLIMGDGNLVTVYMGFPLLMGGMTIAFPALNSLLSRATDTRLQGTALGLSNGLSSLGRVVGPLTAGILFTPENPSAPFIAVAAVGMLAVIWALFFARQPQD